MCILIIVCDLKHLVEKQVLRVGRGNDLERAAAVLRERYTCEPQIARIRQLIQWMEAKATGEEAMTEMRKAIKKRLYKENSADIPDAQKKELLEDLWTEEQRSFDATLARVARLQ